MQLSLLPDGLRIRLSDYGGEQVIAPLLVILRVANWEASTNSAVVSANVTSLHSGSSVEPTRYNRASSDRNPMSLAETSGVTVSEFGVGRWRR